MACRLSVRLLGTDVSCSVTWVENGIGAYALQLSVDTSSLLFSSSSFPHSFIAWPLWTCKLQLFTDTKLDTCPTEGRERENKNELASLFPACFFTPFETEMKLTHLLKHWPMETRSGQETWLEIGFFSVALCLLLLFTSYVTKACLWPCWILLFLLLSLPPGISYLTSVITVIIVLAPNWFRLSTCIMCLLFRGYLQPKDVYLKLAKQSLRAFSRGWGHRWTQDISTSSGDASPHIRGVQLFIIWGSFGWTEQFCLTGTVR